MHFTAKMAEGGGWWGSWVSTAKNKSAEVFEFMKKDISEFSSAVKTEASTIAEAVKSEASTIAEAVKETLQLDNEESPAGTVKKSVSSFLSQLWEPITVDDQLSPIIIKDSQPVSMTDLQYKHHLLITDAETFIKEISDDEKPQFDAWYNVVVEDFNDVESLGRQLSSCPALEDKYRELVPDQVSHSDFWKRYMFRRALMLDQYAEEDRRKAREREEIDNFPWEKEKFATDIELSEEEQIKLLNDYEEEKNLKNQKKMKKELSEPNLKVRERNDLVIVGTETPSQASTSSKESTDGDWEKEFEIEETEDKTDETKKTDT